jgi:hypothetical protein
MRRIPPRVSYTRARRSNNRKNASLCVICHRHGKVASIANPGARLTARRCFGFGAAFGDPRGSRTVTRPGSVAIARDSHAQRMRRAGVTSPNVAIFRGCSREVLGL